VCAEFLMENSVIIENSGTPIENSGKSKKLGNPSFLDFQI
jgi:hypothetical protein